MKTTQIFNSTKCVVQCAGLTPKPLYKNTSKQTDTPSSPTPPSPQPPWKKSWSKGGHRIKTQGIWYVIEISDLKQRKWIVCPILFFFLLFKGVVGGPGWRNMTCLSFWLIWKLRGHLLNLEPCNFCFKHPMTYICSQSTTSHHAQRLICHCVLTVFPGQTDIHL